MTREEFGIIVKGLRAVYATETFIADKNAFDVWYELLKDLDYKGASVSAQKYMMSNHFPPTPADIRNSYHDISHPQHLNESEAWTLVRKAISRSNYYAEEEFAKLPPPVQRAVGAPSQLRTWAADEEYNEEVARSNFFRVYRSEIQQLENYERLTSDIQGIIQNVNKSSYKAQIEQKNQQTIKSLSEKEKFKIEENAKCEDSISMPEEYAKEFGLHE